MTLKPIYRLVLLLLLTACSDGTSFVSVMELPGEKFSRGQSLEFDFDQADTQTTHRIELVIRHRPDFDYETLRFEVRTISPLRKYWIDTIDISLVDSNGKNWEGVDRTTHIDLGVTYRQSVRFEAAGQYNMRIKYLNDIDSLTRLMAIGLIVEKE